MFIIKCRVSGGVTGSRESFVRCNGAVVTFADRAEAQAEAARLTAGRNGNPYRTGDFEYLAVARDRYQGDL